MSSQNNRNCVYKIHTSYKKCNAKKCSIVRKNWYTEKKIQQQRPMASHYSICHTKPATSHFQGALWKKYLAYLNCVHVKKIDWSKHVRRYSNISLDFFPELKNALFSSSKSTKTREKKYGLNRTKRNIATTVKCYVKIGVHAHAEWTQRRSSPFHSTTVTEIHRATEKGIA